MTEPPDLSMLPEADRPIVGAGAGEGPGRRGSRVARRSSARWPSGGTAARQRQRQRHRRRRREPAAWAKAGRRPPTTSTSRPARAAASAAAGLRRPAGPGEVRVAAAAVEIDEDHLLAATAPQKEIGVLRPTILIGIGSFGRRALQEIRCRLDRPRRRRGPGAVLPLPVRRLRPGRGRQGRRAPRRTSRWRPDEVFPVPLQPVTQYRRRQLEQILDWLPREKLYSIPRSLHAGGSRALGRLAFCDNYLRFVTRLRRELQIATHPESLAQSSDQTGLPPRDNTPQVYIFASATGGSGGMLIDLGYAVRRVLARMTTADAPVTAFVYASAPTDPGTSDHELANLYAALTELNHYADPDVTFVAPATAARRGRRSRGRGCRSPRRTSCRCRSDRRRIPRLRLPPGRVRRSRPDHASGHRRSNRSDCSPTGFGRSPFRAFGTYGVWFPRGLLLRSAAQKVCLRLLKEWAEDAPPRDIGAVDAMVDAGHRRPAAQAGCGAAADRARGRARRRRRPGRSDRALAHRAGRAGRTAQAAARTPGRGRAACGNRPAT